MLNSLWFATRLRLLNKRTSKILDKVKKSSKQDLEILERETNTCTAMFHQLRDYEQKHHQGMSREDHQVAERILKNLEEAQRIMKQKKSPWWKKLLQNVFVPFLLVFKDFLKSTKIYDSHIAFRLLVGSLDVFLIKLLPPASL